MRCGAVCAFRRTPGFLNGQLISHYRRTRGGTDLGSEQDTPRPERSVPALAAFRYTDFRWMWSGELISEAGSNMQLVAINWHIYVLTQSPIALGLIGLARIVPLLIFSLVGGVYADAN